MALGDDLNTIQLVLEVATDKKSMKAATESLEKELQGDFKEIVAAIEKIMSSADLKWFAKAGGSIDQLSKQIAYLHEAADGSATVAQSMSKGFKELSGELKKSSTRTSEIGGVFRSLTERAMGPLNDEIQAFRKELIATYGESATATRKVDQLTEAFAKAATTTASNGGKIKDLRGEITKLREKGVPDLEAIAGAGGRMGRFFSDFEKDISKAMLRLGGFRMAAGLVADMGRAVGTASRVAFELAESASQLADSETGFRRLAATMDTVDGRIINVGASLEVIRNAAGGAIDQFTLMDQATKAALAGITPESFARLTTAARALAAVTGRTAPEALERLTQAIAKQERRLLDELGIVVRADDLYRQFAEGIGKTTTALTANEKVAAFLEGTLAKVDDRVARLGGIVEDNQFPFIRFRASVRNLSIAFGEWINQHELFHSILGAVGDVVEDITGLFLSEGRSLDKLEASIQGAKLAQEELNEVLEGTGTALDEISIERAKTLFTIIERLEEEPDTNKIQLRRFKDEFEGLMLSMKSNFPEFSSMLSGGTVSAEEFAKAMDSLSGSLRTRLGIEDQLNYIFTSAQPSLMLDLMGGSQKEVERREKLMIKHQTAVSKAADLAEADAQRAFGMGGVQSVAWQRVLDQRVLDRARFSKGGPVDTRGLDPIGDVKQAQEKLEAESQRYRKEQSRFENLQQKFSGMIAEFLDSGNFLSKEILADMKERGLDKPSDEQFIKVMKQLKIPMGMLTESNPVTETVRRLFDLVFVKATSGLGDDLDNIHEEIKGLLSRSEDAATGIGKTSERSIEALTKNLREVRGRTNLAIQKLISEVAPAAGGNVAEQLRQGGISSKSVFSGFESSARAPGEALFEESDPRTRQGDSTGKLFDIFINKFSTDKEQAKKVLESVGPLTQDLLDVLVDVHKQRKELTAGGITTEFGLDSKDKDKLSILDNIMLSAAEVFGGGFEGTLDQIIESRTAESEAKRKLIEAHVKSELNKAKVNATKAIVDNDLSDPLEQVQERIKRVQAMGTGLSDEIRNSAQMIAGIDKAVTALQEKELELIVRQEDADMKSSTAILKAGQAAKKKQAASDIKGLRATLTKSISDVSKDPTLTQTQRLGEIKTLQETFLRNVNAIADQWLSGAFVGSGGVPGALVAAPDFLQSVIDQASKSIQSTEVAIFKNSNRLVRQAHDLRMKQIRIEANERADRNKDVFSDSTARDVSETLTGFAIRDLEAEMKASKVYNEIEIEDEKLKLKKIEEIQTDARQKQEDAEQKSQDGFIKAVKTFRVKLNAAERASQVVRILGQLKAEEDALIKTNVNIDIANTQKESIYTLSSDRIKAITKDALEDIGNSWRETHPTSMENALARVRQKYEKHLEKIMDAEEKHRAVTATMDKESLADFAKRRADATTNLTNAEKIITEKETRKMHANALQLQIKYLDKKERDWLGRETEASKTIRKARFDEQIETEKLILDQSIEAIKKRIDSTEGEEKKALETRLKAVEEARAALDNAEDTTGKMTAKAIISRVTEYSDAMGELALAFDAVYGGGRKEEIEDVNKIMDTGLAIAKDFATLPLPLALLVGGARALNLIAEYKQNQREVAEEQKRFVIESKSTLHELAIDVGSDMGNEITRALEDGFDVDEEKIIDNFVKKEIGTKIARILSAELADETLAIETAVTQQLHAGKSVDNAEVQAQASGMTDKLSDLLTSDALRGRTFFKTQKEGYAVNPTITLFKRLMGNRPGVEPDMLIDAEISLLDKAQKNAGGGFTNQFLTKNDILDAANELNSAIIVSGNLNLADARSAAETATRQLVGSISGSTTALLSGSSDVMTENIPTATFRAVTEPQANQMLLIMTQQVNHLQRIAQNTDALPLIAERAMSAPVRINGAPSGGENHGLIQ